MASLRSEVFELVSQTRTKTSVGGLTRTSACIAMLVNHAGVSPEVGANLMTIVNNTMVYHAEARRGLKKSKSSKK